MRERNVSLLPHLSGLLVQGLSAERLEGKDAGWASIKEALLLGEKDRLILPFALLNDLLPFLERFASWKGGDLEYRTRLLHEARYHQSVSSALSFFSGPALSKREKQLLHYLEEGKAAWKSPSSSTPKRTRSRAN